MHSPEPEGKPPTENLFDAVKRSSCSDVEKSIKRGAFVNAKHEVNKATPLHYAAWKGNKEIVDILLQNKADPNSVCDKGYTPLHYAAKFSHLACVKILMGHGAIYNAISESGKTPVAMAKDTNIVQLFTIVDDSFKKIRNDNARIIDDLNQINVSDLKTIMNTRNTDNQCLIAYALQTNFELADKLKYIPQDDAVFELNVASNLLSLGDYENSLNIFKRLVEERTQLLGSDNPATLEFQMYIGKALYLQGNYREALDMFQSILCKQTKILGFNCKDTLYTKSSIALVLYLLGKSEEAVDMFRAIYPKQVQIVGPNHYHAVETYFHMALALQISEKYEEALKINLEVLKIRQKTLGPAHMDTIMTKNNIATVYCGQGRYEEALEIFNEVLERKKEIVGIKHADTLRTMRSIAGVFFKQNKYQKALNAFEEVLNIQKKTLRQNHPEILSTEYNIAETLLAQGKFLCAFKVLKNFYDRSVNIFGPTHPNVSNAYARILRIVEGLNTFLPEECDPMQLPQYVQKMINIASCRGDIPTIKEMLELGVHVNDADTDGRTPLHFAVSNRRHALINFLLQNGADVALVTNKGNTPLHTAASKNYQEIAQVLLQHVDKNEVRDFVNAKTASSGATSLHVAAKAGYFEIVKLLLKYGAIYDIPNKEGKIPGDLATDHKILELFKLIEEFFELVWKGNDDDEVIDKLKTLKPEEFEIVTNAARCNRGNGLLQVAVINKRENIASTLLVMLEKLN